MLVSSELHCGYTAARETILVTHVLPLQIVRLKDTDHTILSKDLENML